MDHRTGRTDVKFHLKHKTGRKPDTRTGHQNSGLFRILELIIKPGSAWGRTIT